MHSGHAENGQRTMILNQNNNGYDQVNAVNLIFFPYTATFTPLQLRCRVPSNVNSIAHKEKDLCLGINSKLLGQQRNAGM